jgi:hypothetical protein
MIRKYFIYITFVAVLLIAWYSRASIKDNIVSIVHNIHDVRKVSPYADDRIEGDIKQAMER